MRGERITCDIGGGRRRGGIGRTGGRGAGGGGNIKQKINKCHYRIDYRFLKFCIPFNDSIALSFKISRSFILISLVFLMAPN